METREQVNEIGRVESETGMIVANKIDCNIFFFTSIFIQ